MRKTIAGVIAISLVILLPGCGGGKSGFDNGREITVVSREPGSGTRTAFIEMFGVEVKNDDGTKKDLTTREAVIAEKTDVMLATIAGNEYAIGFVSLVSLNGTVKALDIDGVKATVDNVINSTYKIARPFNIATRGEPTGLAADFVEFILSKEGQEVVTKNKCVAVSDNSPSYTGGNKQGTVKIAGSSSVSPVMEKLMEAYLKLNPDAVVEILANDSSAGIAAASDGTCDIGMASRNLKDSEKESLLETTIALDGIAVIVSVDNPLSSATSGQIKRVFMGETESWDCLIGDNPEGA